MIGLYDLLYRLFLASSFRYAHRHHLVSKPPFERIEDGPSVLDIEENQHQHNYPNRHVNNVLD